METSFQGCLFFVFHLRGHKNAPFSGRCHQFHHPIHENAHFHGQSRQNESSVMILQVLFTEQDHIVDVRVSLLPCVG